MFDPWLEYASTIHQKSFIHGKFQIRLSDGSSWGSKIIKLYTDPKMEKL